LESVIAMRIIELDAHNWNSVNDYLDALRTALGSPEGHGSSIDAFLDSMIYGGMNRLNPPYTIQLRNTKGLPRDVLDQIQLLKQSLLKQRGDVDVSVELVP